MTMLGAVSVGQLDRVFVLIIFMTVLAIPLLLVALIFRPLRRLAANGICLAIAVLLVVGVIQTIMNRKYGESPRRSSCMNNLQSIGKSMIMYSMDHDEAFPSYLSGLKDSGANTPKLFICKSSGHAPGALTNVDEWTDYVYVSGLTAAAGMDCVLAFCPPENHAGKGANVLFADGAVHWMDVDEFVAMTNDPAKFFGTPDTNKLAEIQKRVRILRPTKQIKE